ncbi:MAG: hypothetical protein ACKVP6_02340 [Mycobacterium sp.]
MRCGSPRSTLVGIVVLVFVNCGGAAAQGPGAAYPATAEVSDQKAGSVLLYPYYSSGSGSANAHNTRINVTQTADVPIATRIYLIRSNGTVLARHICLQAKQTDSYLMGSLDPGNSGYIVIVAVDANGCPLGANTLIGEAVVKRATGHSANITAYAYAALFSGTLSGCGPSSTTATVNLDGTAYNRSPRTVAIDKVRSRADGNDTLLILERIGGNLATGSIGNIGPVSGTLFDDSGLAHPFSFNAAQPQLVQTIGNSLPMTSPSFDTAVPPGTVGWMKMAGDADIGLLGAVINFNANAGAQASAFNGGHGLRALTVTPAASFVVPVGPGC